MDLEKLNKLLSNPKVLELARNIEVVNPPVKEGIARTSGFTFSPSVFIILAVSLVNTLTSKT